MSRKRKSFALKIALFATGISGIVAEYILSTLASYFIGNAILQFTLIVSIMLFAMGLGSRISKSFDKNLIFYFVIIELVLSVLVSFVAIISYLIYGFTDTSWIIIYLLSILIGLLIGLEIPFATRINNEFEELRLNISSILENDYYGSLIGGLFFAFVGLPYLGLTYTPFVLGFINLSVSFWMFLVLQEYLKPKQKQLLNFLYVVVVVGLLSGVFFAKEIILFGEQAKYTDKVIFTKQTKHQKLVVTKWNKWHSLYINGNQQLSTFDEFLYHEPMVHTALGLAKDKTNILILGGGDGCIVRELLKYEDVINITLVDLDQQMIEVAKTNPIFTNLNQNALQSKKLQIIIQDAFTFLENTKQKYDVVLVDLPDPNNVDLNKLYTKEFYKLSANVLKDSGCFITQSGSPYYATKAFYCIEKSIRASGLQTLALHNQILTLGEWSWILARKNPITKEELQKIDISKLKLKWLNQDALTMMSNFGKPLIDTTNIEINTIFSPVLYTYYKNGNWELY